MKHRAIKDLAQMNDKDLVNAVSEGLCLIYENGMSLWKSSQVLHEKEKAQGYRVLEAFACEEAAKYLILLDALRCPRTDNALFTRQLQKFNEHLAKGIYSKVCDWRPDSYGRLVGYVESQLKEYYLDGPNGIDWIFRNSIISEREEYFYVDYIAVDGESNSWLTPKRFDDVLMDFGTSIYIPGVLRVIENLHSLEIYQPNTLLEFSKYWRGVEFLKDTHHVKFRELNENCLLELHKKNLLNLKEEMVSGFVEYYPYPLYREQMKEEKVSKEDLRDKQNKWSPDW